MSFVLVRAAILSKLNDRKTAGVLGEVYDGKQDEHKLEFKNYPVVELIRSGNENDYLTNHEDLPVYIFKIWIYTEIENQGRPTAEKSIDPVLDDLLYQFAHDRTLGGVCDGGVEPAITDHGEVPWREKLHYATILTLKCRRVSDLS